MLRMATENGDLDWEARVRVADHRLDRTPAYLPGEHKHLTTAWSHAHRDFHRALLEGWGNSGLLDTFDRLWTASELARRLSATRTPAGDAEAEHPSLEQATLARDADTAGAALVQHRFDQPGARRTHPRGLTGPHGPQRLPHAAAGFPSPEGGCQRVVPRAAAGDASTLRGGAIGPRLFQCPGERLG